MVTPLNWGLGHATRCIPIIDELLAQGQEVLLASDGRAGLLLQKEYPTLPYFELPSYQIRYPGSNMIWNMAWQLPRMMRAIRREAQVIRQLQEEEKIDIIISDNRFGCYSQKAHCVYMTHQLNIRIPLAPLQWMVNQIHRSFIRQFDECWIPDTEKTPGLGGDLSHGQRPPKTTYLGPLSRFERMNASIKYDLLIVLSGPEPQRTHLQELLLEQLTETKMQVLLVSGQPEREEHYFWNEQIEVVSFMTSKDLNKAIASSRLVICRSGYSSILDLAKMQQKAILIPTPGQTEQLYLAEQLRLSGRCYSDLQSRFELGRALEKAATYTGFEAITSDAFQLEKAIKAVIKKHIDTPI